MIYDVAFGTMKQSYTESCPLQEDKETISTVKDEKNKLQNKNTEFM